MPKVKAATRGVPVSAQEVETITRMFAAGNKTPWEIAQHLHRSYTTVEHYCKKLGYVRGEAKAKKQLDDATCEAIRRLAASGLNAGKIAHTLKIGLGPTYAVLRRLGHYRRTYAEVTLKLSPKVHERLRSSAEHRGMTVENLASGLLSGAISKGHIGNLLAGFSESALTHEDAHDETVSNRLRERQQRKRAEQRNGGDTKMKLENAAVSAA